VIRLTEIDVVKTLFKAIYDLREAEKKARKFYEQWEEEKKRADRLLKEGYVPLEQVEYLEKLKFEKEKKYVEQKIEVKKLKGEVAKWEKFLEKVPLTHRSLDFFAGPLAEVENTIFSLRQQKAFLEAQRKRLQEALPLIDRQIGELRRGIREAKKRRTMAQVGTFLQAFITQNWAPLIVGTVSGLFGPVKSIGEAEATIRQLERDKDRIRREIENLGKEIKKVETDLNLWTEEKKFLEQVINRIKGIMAKQAKEREEALLEVRERAEKESKRMTEARMVKPRPTYRYEKPKIEIPSWLFLIPLGLLVVRK